MSSQGPVRSGRVVQCFCTFPGPRLLWSGGGIRKRCSYSCHRSVEERSHQLLPPWFSLQSPQFKKQAGGFSQLLQSSQEWENYSSSHFSPNRITPILGRCKKQGRGDSHRLNACIAPSPGIISRGGKFPLFKLNICTWPISEFVIHHADTSHTKTHIGMVYFYKEN